MEKLTESDIELILYCLDFTEEMYKRIPFKTFRKITNGKISKEQVFNEFNIVKSKLKNK